ncbi:hypothetical protein ACWEH1_28295 [Micromonospora chersina]
MRALVSFAYQLAVQLPLLDSIDGRPLLIGRSLGTDAAAIAAQRSLPAVWLTPLLTLPWVADWS